MSMHRSRYTSALIVSVCLGCVQTVGAQNQVLSVGKQYAYFKTIPGQPPNHYRDDGPTYGTHTVHSTTGGLGKFGRGNLSDGKVSTSASGGAGTPHLAIWARCCGNAPAADIVFDLGTVELVTDFTLGTVISASLNNNAPDDVTISFSITGTVYTSLQYHNLEKMYGPLADGHHDMRVMASSIIPARYVKFSFDGGSMKEPNGSDPDEKWMLDEITIRGLGATCKAATSNYGKGLTGRSGVPTLTASAVPKFGAKINLLASNSSGSASNGMLLVGLREDTISFLGGTLLVTPLVLTPVAVPATGLQIPLTVPGPPCTFPVCLQFLQLDKAAVAGVSMTRGLRLDLGT
jgi:hypothetical protein